MNNRLGGKWSPQFCTRLSDIQYTICFTADLRGGGYYPTSVLVRFSLFFFIPGSENVYCMYMYYIGLYTLYRTV